MACQGARHNFVGFQVKEILPQIIDNNNKKSNSETEQNIIKHLQIILQGNTDHDELIG